MLDYIKLVCEGDLSVLVASGKPLDTELEVAKMGVLTEFSELSGNENTTAAMSLLADIYGLKAQKLSYLAAMYAMGDLFDEAKEFFRTKGFDVSGWSQNDPKKCLKRINAEIKAIDMRMAKKIKEYNSMAAKKGDKETTAKDIRTEMAILSQHQNHPIADDCNLEMYAGYRLSYNAHLKALEHAKHRTNT